MCAVATKLPKGGKDVPPEALEGLQCRKSLSASLPRFGWGRQARRMGCSRMGRGVVEHATLRHGCRWWAYASSHAFGSANTQIFAHGRCCHHWNSSKLQAFKPAPKFERGWATASSAPRPWQAHSERVLISSRRTPPPPTRISRVEVALPTFPQGAFLSGAAMAGLASPWRFLRRPDNTVTSGWGNMSPKAESEGDLVLVFK